MLDRAPVPEIGWRSSPPAAAAGRLQEAKSVEFVNELPVNAYRKILNRDLRRRYATAPVLPDAASAGRS